MHFLTGDSISQLPLFVSLSVCQYLFLTHLLRPLVAEQLQADADGGGVRSKAHQVYPGNLFFYPHHFIFCFFPAEQIGEYPAYTHTPLLIPLSL